MIDPKIKLITILGPTASGKTDLALDLAEQFNGEIICADSRTIYRGMDIGTAKPTAEEQARVPHHLLDVVDPGETISAGSFKPLAEAIITDVAARGRTPFLVGGSGLYIDSILFDYHFPKSASSEERHMLEALTNIELRNRLELVNSVAFEMVDLSNRRRLIRAIETTGQDVSKKSEQLPNILSLGLRLNKEVAQQRIEKRIKKMLEEGFLNEVRQIGTTYGWDSESLSGVGYRAFKDVVLGSKTLEEGAADFVQGDLHLVKKQQTWFKRNDAIIWLENISEAPRLVDAFLKGK